ncbi:MAG: DUF2752 domain-containing protein [Acidimicrobiales bacterium]
MAERRRVLTATYPVDVTGLRFAGVAMVGLGLALPLLPHNPGLPCPLRTLTGVPCPACGLTTAVKATLSGHWGHAVAANPFGMIAVLVAVLLVFRPRMRVLRIPLSLLVFGALASWSWELRRFGYL